MKSNTITHYLLNGLFLSFLIYLLFFQAKAGERLNPLRDFSHIFQQEINLDSIISELKSSKLTLQEMASITDRVVAEKLNTEPQGKAILYAVAKQAQLKINDNKGILDSAAFQHVLEVLAQHNLYPEIPQSNWTKFWQYSGDCLFKGLRCDHLLNRVTNHRHFHGVLVFMALLLTGSIYLLSKNFFLKR